MAQTYKNLQLILVDDGSTDRSLEICRKLEKKDARILVLHHGNKGVSFTRNRGIEFATGHYLMFLDGDDTVLPDMIEEYVTAANRSGADIVIGGIRIIEEGQPEKVLLPQKCGVYGSEVWNEICLEPSGLFGYVSNKLYRLEIIKTNHVRFDINRSAQEDMDFALSAFDVAGKFCLIPYAGYVYLHDSKKRRNHPNEQYIENKIKLLRCARQNCLLENAAERKVVDEIEGILYVALYHCTAENFEETCWKYRAIPDFQPVLQEKSHHSLVACLFRDNHVFLLKVYFCARKALSRVIHRPR